MTVAGKLSNVDFVQASLDAYNAQDLDAYCAFFSNDVVVADLNGPVTIRGAGAGATVGAWTLVLYDTKLEPGATVEDLSLVMKGEVLPRGTRWAGIPASRQISASTIAVIGVALAGFSTTVFPVASAGASFQAAISSGKFQGTICAQTPNGSRVV